MLLRSPVGLHCNKRVNSITALLWEPAKRNFARFETYVSCNVMGRTGTVRFVGEGFPWVPSWAPQPLPMLSPLVVSPDSINPKDTSCHLIRAHCAASSGLLSTTNLFEFRLSSPNKRHSRFLICTLMSILTYLRKWINSAFRFSTLCIYRRGLVRFGLSV